ncbi:MAG: sigma-70 family RNA polymerase sigma factor [Pseudorhodoferax sp.]
MELSAPFTRALLDGFGAAYGDLLRIAARSTGSRDEARDLVHDTWLRLAEHAEAGQAATEGEPAPRDATAYLATMARHLALDAHRRAQRTAQHHAAIAQQPAPQSPDVAETVMYRQALAALERALAGLPARSRAVFEAHRVHGEPQPDIAARLGVSLNTVERDLSLAGDCIADALRRWRGERVDGARRSGRRRGLGALLGLGGLGVAGALGWRHWQAAQDGRPGWQAALATARGQRARHALPDGSTVELDADSRVQLDFFRARRAVQLLQGAAFFAVAHDRDRPFSVQAGAVRVTVLGTRFGVERLPAGGVLVQVESGRVRVEPAPGRPAQDLGAGQALLVLADGTARPAGGEAAPWRHGEIVFADSTLGEALARLQRYTPEPLQASPDAAALPVSGRVRIAQARAWLDQLPHALPVRVQRRDGGAWLVTRR